MELPKFVLEEMERMVKEYKMNLNSLKQQYSNIYNTPWIKSDEQFERDEDRHGYCMRKLWIDLALKGEEMFQVIPVGYTEAQMTTKEFWQSKIYLCAKMGEERKLLPMICQAETANLYKDVEPFLTYSVQAVNAGVILRATESTKFDEGKPIPLRPQEFLEKIGIPRFTIAEASSNRSRRTEGGFIDELDLKMVAGIIVHWNTGERKDGSKWAFYHIVDESSIQQRMTKEGYIVPRRMMIWCPSTQQIYDRDSEIIVLGTISGEKEPVMNAISIIPLHAKFKG